MKLEARARARGQTTKKENSISLNEGEVYFKLVSDDINPDEITRYLGIHPTKVSRKAHPSPKHNCWMYSSGKETADIIDIYEMSSAVRGVLESKVDEIARLVQEEELFAELQVVLTLAMDDNHPTPAIGFEKETIAFLSKIKASIDIDIYMQ